MKPKPSKLIALRDFLNQLYSGDDTDNVTDMLADLMHFSDRYKVDFDNALKNARGHHEQERTHK
jgi:hypothetical protein